MLISCWYVVNWLSNEVSNLSTDKQTDRQTNERSLKEWYWRNDFFSKISDIEWNGVMLMFSEHWEHNSAVKSEIAASYKKSWAKTSFSVTRSDRERTYRLIAEKPEVVAQIWPDRDERGLNALHVGFCLSSLRWILRILHGLEISSIFDTYLTFDLDLWPLPEMSL